MLPNLRIASPCSADWDKMIGDDRVRICPQCKLNVYNFSAMHEGEIAQLVARRDGRLCARWYRRADGTMLTSDCHVGFRARAKRVSKVAGAALTALLGVSPLAAQETQPPQSRSVQLRQQSTDSDGTISVVVTDKTGARVPNAGIEIADEISGQRFGGTTDEMGIFQVRLHEGTYKLKVTALNLKTAEMKGVHLAATESKDVQFALQVDETVLMGEVVVTEPLDLLPTDSDLPSTLPFLSAPNSPKPPSSTQDSLFRRFFRKISRH